MSRSVFKAASAPRARSAIRILVVDGASGAMRVVPNDRLPASFDPRDLLIFNDAATLPASFAGHTASGEEIELRLVGAVAERRWTAALLGQGDFRTRTETRPPPPRVFPRERLTFGGGLVADVVDVRPESERLLVVDFTIADRPATSLDHLWATLYRSGRVVQYAHVPEPLALWDVQNVYAARPWAVEMPSAGRAFGIETLLELRRRGVALASVTHAAGLSAVGDPTIDAMLPLPERYEVTEATWKAIAAARRRGGRVVAIGTSVARALEGGARSGRRAGTTDLRIGPGTRRAIVDAVLTGVHEADTSHFALLRAFASPSVLEGALVFAEREGLLGHEMGDLCLVWGQPRENLSARRGEPVSNVPVAAPRAPPEW